MKWLNLEISTLHSERYIGEDPVGRATWIALLAYCAEQENGGLIAECMDWKDRKWQQVMGVTMEEVRRPSGLWSWEGSSLRVWKYPVDKEWEIAQKRLAAAATNQIRRAAESGAVTTPAPAKNSEPPPEDEEEAPALPPRLKLGVALRPTREAALLYAAKIGLPEAELDKWFNHYDSNGWKVGKNPMRNWEASMRNWKINNETRRSQNGRQPYSPGAQADLHTAGDGAEYVEAGRKL